jgi:hypothetical protein
MKRLLNYFETNLNRLGYSDALKNNLPNGFRASPPLKTFTARPHFRRTGMSALPVWYNVCFRLRHESGNKNGVLFGHLKGEKTYEKNLYSGGSRIVGGIFDVALCPGGRRRAI